MEEIDIKKIDIEKILDMFEDDYVIPASKMERPQSALDREMFEDFNKRNPQADGGRIPFAKAKSVQKSLDVDEEEYVPQKKTVKKSKSAVRKPFAPEIEKRIINCNRKKGVMT